MSSAYEDVLRNGNPFSEEYREALSAVLGELRSQSVSPPEDPSPYPFRVFLAKLTDKQDILPNRAWKDKWEFAHNENRNSSAGTEDDYFHFALNGAEVNNPVEPTGITVPPTKVSFGVTVGALSNPASVVTLLPLTEGPDPLVIMMEMLDPLDVTFTDATGTETTVTCRYFTHAANQVSVACS